MNLNTYNTYIVYKHTAPNNKVYIGISKHDPKYRGLNNGRGYKTQTVFFNAIIKYGWVNFKHEILFTNLSEEQALNKEEELIRLYKSYDRRYGYNVSLRGAKYNEEHRNGGNKNSRRKEVIKLPKFSGNGREVLKKDYDNNIIETYTSVARAAYNIKMPTETVRTRLNKDKTINFESYYLCYSNNSTPKIEMLSMENESLRVFNSVGEAYKYLNKTNKGGIKQCCVGLRNSYSGYKWKFKYEDKNN